MVWFSHPPFVRAGGKLRVVGRAATWNPSSSSSAKGSRLHLNANQKQLTIDTQKEMLTANANTFSAMCFVSLAAASPIIPPTAILAPKILIKMNCKFTRRGNKRVNLMSTKQTQYVINLRSKYNKLRAWKLMSTCLIIWNRGSSNLYIHMQK